MFSVYIKKAWCCVYVTVNMTALHCVPFSDRKNLNTSQETKIHLLNWKERRKYDYKVWWRNSLKLGYYDGHIKLIGHHFRLCTLHGNNNNMPILQRYPTKHYSYTYCILVCSFQLRRRIFVSSLVFKFLRSLNRCHCTAAQI
mgnify:CR=1 FL=1